ATEPGSTEGRAPVLVRVRRSARRFVVRFRRLVRRVAVSRNDEPVSWHRPIAFMTIFLPLYAAFAWVWGHIVGSPIWASHAAMMTGLWGVVLFAGSRERRTVPRHRTVAVVVSAPVFLLVGFVLRHLIDSRHTLSAGFVVDTVASAAALYCFAAVTHLP